MFNETLFKKNTRSQLICKCVRKMFDGRSREHKRKTFLSQDNNSYKTSCNKFEDKNDFLKNKLSRCASCVARCIPLCDLCAYFRNPQGQTISSWILVY